MTARDSKRQISISALEIKVLKNDVHLVYQSKILTALVMKATNHDWQPAYEYFANICLCNFTDQNGFQYKLAHSK